MQHPRCCGNVLIKSVFALLSARSWRRIVYAANLASFLIRALNGNHVADDWIFRTENIFDLFAACRS